MLPQFDHNFVSVPPQLQQPHRPATSPMFLPNQQQSSGPFGLAPPIHMPAGCMHMPGGLGGIMGTQPPAMQTHQTFGMQHMQLPGMGMNSMQPHQPLDMQPAGGRSPIIDGVPRPSRAPNAEDDIVGAGASPMGQHPIIDALNKQTNAFMSALIR